MLLALSERTFAHLGMRTVVVYIIADISERRQIRSPSPIREGSQKRVEETSDCPPQGRKKRERKSLLSNNMSTLLDVGAEERRRLFGQEGDMFLRLQALLKASAKSSRAGKRRQRYHVRAQLKHKFCGGRLERKIHEYCCFYYLRTCTNHVQASTKRHIWKNNQKYAETKEDQEVQLP